MTLKISKEMDNKLSEVSKLLNLQKTELINRALVIYLDNLEKYLELKRDQEIWDRLSDEALENFERAL